MSKDIFKQPGRGIGSRKEAEKIAKQMPGAKEPEPVKDGKGRVIWHDTPCVAEQLLHHPQTCRKGAARIEFFDLSSSEDRNRYNDLLKKAHPVEAPQVILEERIEFAPSDGFKALCRVRPIQYMHFITAKK